MFVDVSDVNAQILTGAHWYLDLVKLPDELLCGLGLHSVLQSNHDVAPFVVKL